MEAYKYQALESPCRNDSSDDGGSSSTIRILTIYPGSGDQTVSCQLRVTSLIEATDNATYEALSYCWGVEDATMCIFLRNEQQEESIFNVRPNLYSALRAFRFADRPRQLWIDAICINQMDDAEKSKQVPLMRRIYEGALGTLIWLGEGTADSKSAIILVHSLKDALIRCGNVIPKIGMFNSNDLAQHQLPSLWSRDYVRLLTMLEQPWFGRAWIVQEVTVSKKAKLYWGPDSVDWMDLVMGIDFALRAELPFAIHPAINCLLPIAEEAARYEHGDCRLISVLLRHRPCQATVPADKIYAFLGLTERNQDNLIPIEIDYKRDLVTVYTDVARKIVEHDRTLDLLSLPPMPFGPSVVGLPSWVPDWSFPSGVVLRQTISAENRSLANAEQAGGWLPDPFCAAGPAPYSPVAESSNKTLVVEGHQFANITAAQASYDGLHMPTSEHGHVGAIRGHVQTVVDIGQTVVSFFQTRNVYMQWEDSLGLSSSVSIPTRYVTGEELVDAFSQTLLIGNISPAEDRLELRAQYFAWSRAQRPSPILDKLKLGFLQTPISAARNLTSSILTRDVPTVFQKRLKHIMFRRLIRTDNGYMGLSCGQTQVGDQIWLLKGSKVPVVLRKSEIDNAWKVVGDAYVHGIMYGEGFDKTRCCTIELC